jgi:hypothetical protein
MKISDDLKSTVVESFSDEYDNSCSRFFIDKRIGIIAVIDRQHPEYDINRQGCHGDLPWVVAHWQGYTDDTGWNLYDWQIEKAEHLCELLNRLIN